MNSTTYYRRENLNWLTSHPTDKSLTYWRAQAKGIFTTYPNVQLIEVVRTGKKTDSALLSRKYPNHVASDQYVIIASTSGSRYGKSRRDIKPIEENVVETGLW